MRLVPLLALSALLELGTGFKAKRDISEGLLRVARHHAYHSTCTLELTCSLQPLVEVGVLGSGCSGKETES